MSKTKVTSVSIPLDKLCKLKEFNVQALFNECLETMLVDNYSRDKLDMRTHEIHTIRIDAEKLKELKAKNIHISKMFQDYLEMRGF